MTLKRESQKNYLMDSNFKIHHVFPSTIYQEKLESHEHLKQIFLKIHPKYSFDPFSVEGYYLATGEHHGKVDVHQENELSSFLVCLKKSIFNYFEYLSIPPNFFDFSITKSWFTYLLKNYRIDRHSHYGNGLSFVYYIESNDEHFELDFFDSYEKRIESFGGSFMTTLGESQEYFQEANVKNLSYKVISEEGTLLIFPSYLMHSVPEFVASEVRLSYVGDIFINLKTEYKDFEFGYPPNQMWKSLD